MRGIFPTTHLRQHAGIATHTGELISASSMGEQLQFSVNAELAAPESRNRAVDIGPTFERAEGQASRMIRRARELVTDSGHRSLRPMP
jgi:hypothetical protein